MTGAAAGIVTPEISSAGAAAGATGGEGGGGAATAGLAVGTMISPLQCGHLPRRPAAASLSVSCAWQVGQWKLMGMAKLNFASNRVRAPEGQLYGWASRFTRKTRPHGSGRT
jgi:hypothetical protein